MIAVEVSPTAASATPEAHARLILAALDLADRRVTLACQTSGRDSHGTVDERRAVVEACPGCPLLDLCAAAGEGERFGVWGGVDLGVDGKNHPRSNSLVGRSNATQLPHREVPRGSPGQREGVKT